MKFIYLRSYIASMPKKSRKGKIKTGIFEYEWYKEIDKIDADFDLIKSQIDSFLYIIENPDDFKSSVYIEEMSVLSRVLVSYGHLAKLEDEYKEKFKRINKYIKEKTRPAKPLIFFDSGP